MNKPSLLVLSFCTVVLLGMPSQKAHADITMVAQELDGGVAITYTGSLRISQLAASASVSFDTTAFGTVNAPNARIEFAPSGGGSESDMTEYWDVVSSRPSSFGSGISAPSSFTGDYFYLGYDDLGVPDNYIDNRAISGTMTFNGATFVSMGLTPTNAGFPYVWIFENGQQATLQIGNGANNDAVATALQKKLKKLKSKLKNAKRKKQKKKVKKIKSQLKSLKAKLKAL